MAKISKIKQIRIETFASSGKLNSSVFTCLRIEGTELMDFSGLRTLKVLRAESFKS